MHSYTLTPLHLSTLPLFLPPLPAKPAEAESQIGEGTVEIIFLVVPQLLVNAIDVAVTDGAGNAEPPGDVEFQPDLRSENEHIVHVAGKAGIARNIDPYTAPADAGAGIKMEELMRSKRVAQPEANMPLQSVFHPANVAKTWQYKHVCVRSWVCT